MPLFKLIIKVITTILLVCYPAIIFISFKYGYANLSFYFLIIIFMLRLLSFPSIIPKLGKASKITASLGLFFVITSWLFAKYELLLYYPVIVNLSLFIVFSHSLITGPTIIEQFARIQNQDLSVKAIKYTKIVTIVWTSFFLLNGSIALCIVLYDNLNLWAIYNGCISYILIAALMGGEWLIRKRFQD